MNIKRLQTARDKAQTAKIIDRAGVMLVGGLVSGLFLVAINSPAVERIHPGIEKSGPKPVGPPQLVHHVCGAIAFGRIWPVGC